MSNKWNDYKIAELSQNEFQNLRDKEDKLNSETGKKYILIAYETK